MLQVGYLDLECGILNEQLAHPWIAARGTYTWSGMFNVLHVLMEGMFTTNLMRILTMLVYCHIANLFFFFCWSIYETLDHPFYRAYRFWPRPAILTVHRASLSAQQLQQYPTVTRWTKQFSQCPVDCYHSVQQCYCSAHKCSHSAQHLILQCPVLLSQCPVAL